MAQDLSICRALWTELVNYNIKKSPDVHDIS